MFSFSLGHKKDETESGVVMNLEPVLQSEVSQKEKNKYHILMHIYGIYQNGIDRDFPGGSVVKNLPANAGDMGSISGPGRSHMLWSN